MIKLKIITFNILIILFIVVFLAFAQEDEKTSDPAASPVTAPVETKSSDPATSPATAPVETKSPIQQMAASITQSAGDSYNYNPLGKPDPFRPFVETDTKRITEKKDGKTGTSSSIFPLQRVATEKFKVTGIAGNQLRRVAIVEDATKKFYPLFKGTYIGLKNGKVVEIMADRVIVEERDENIAKRIILKLRKD